MCSAWRETSYHHTITERLLALVCYERREVCLHRERSISIDGAGYQGISEPQVLQWATGSSVAPTIARQPRISSHWLLSGVRYLIN